MKKKKKKKKDVPSDMCPAMIQFRLRQCAFWVDKDAKFLHFGRQFVRF